MTLEVWRSWYGVSWLNHSLHFGKKNLSQESIQEVTTLLLGHQERFCQFPPLDSWPWENSPTYQTLTDRILASWGILPQPSRPLLPNRCCAYEF